MSLRQCDKCNEMIDEGKAFCPNCGHALLDEDQGGGAADDDQSNKTVQFDESLFNVMLSDMGLDISKAPDAAVKPPDVVILPVQTAVKPPENPPDESNASYTKWLILGLILVLALFLIIVVAAVLVFLYLSYK